MIAVITGDVINSREGNATNWLSGLKEVLNQYGVDPSEWEIFRGDSFQLKVKPSSALLASLHIKAALKLSARKDVRIAIGIGDEEYPAKKITESNGTAYIHSGDCFESLKKQTIAVNTGNEKIDESVNLMLMLALLTADNWSPIVSEIIKTSIENPEEYQKVLAKKLNKSQSTVSEALKRGGYDEILKLNYYFQNQISSL
jgi:hypothetical protein|tara:strand:+ start:1289 stop:1888 length:600 start_codon:yes stop_codon:yes gene_type:complete